MEKVKHNDLITRTTIYIADCCITLTSTASSNGNHKEIVKRKKANHIQTKYTKEHTFKVIKCTQNAYIFCFIWKRKRKHARQKHIQHLQYHIFTSIRKRLRGFLFMIKAYTLYPIFLSSIWFFQWIEGFILKISGHRAWQI